MPSKTWARWCGDNLLDSTLRQILLSRLLDLKVPGYAHVPLVLGPDGRHLAKRYGAVTLDDRGALGEETREVLGWMARSASPGRGRRRPSRPPRALRPRPPAARADSLVPGAGVSGANPGGLANAVD